MAVDVPVIGSRAGDAFQL